MMFYAGLCVARRKDRVSNEERKYMFASVIAQILLCFACERKTVGLIKRWAVWKTVARTDAVQQKQRCACGLAGEGGRGFGCFSRCCTDWRI